jgi:hypothetical protein
MKKQTPMQMRKKEVKSDPKQQAVHKAQRPASAMERYAQQRVAKQKAMAVTPISPIEQFDAHSDMHTLARAAEIRRHPGRLRAAKNAAKQRIKDLTEV